MPAVVTRSSVGRVNRGVRSNLRDNRAARVLFCIAHGHMVLLHGFVKKTQKTPAADLALARKRMKEIEQ